MEVEEKFKSTKDALETAIKDANDRLVKLTEEKQEAEEELTAVNKNLSSTQSALKLSEVKVHLTKRKVEDVKAK